MADRITVSSDDLWKAFCWGADYGQLLMEEERDMEDWADAFQGHIFDSKRCAPAQIAPRRQLMSDKWREAKRESKRKFFALQKRAFEAEKELKNG
jgi:hypothetical protein